MYSALTSLTIPFQNNILVTGGEDAKINVWLGLGDPDDSAMDIDITAFSPGSRKRELDWEAEEQVGVIDKCHMSANG